MELFLIKFLESHVKSKAMVTNPDPALHIFCRVAQKMNNKMLNYDKTTY